MALIWFLASFPQPLDVALIPGTAAREVAVAALGTVYAIDGGKKPPPRSARRWRANGRSPPRSRFSSGTSSRRNAPRRSR
jgi:Fe2+ transport system protein B